MKKFASYDRTVPFVTFDSKELEGFMYDFMIENINGNTFVNSNISVNEYVGMVLLRLGFNSGDKVELRDVSFDNNVRTVCCVVNGIGYYEMKFINVLNSRFNTEITLINYNEEYTYKCVPYRLSGIGIRLFKTKELEMYADGVTYVRELCDNKVKLNLYYDDYELELYVEKPKDLELPLYDSNWEYARYRLDNEMRVKCYLLDFFPIIMSGDIVNVYKEIVKLSLGNDVSKYPEIVLKFSYCNKVTDLIYLKYGELERFGVTLLRMDRSLFINRDGSFDYEFNDMENMFSVNMNVSDDKIIYNIAIDKNSDVSLISDIIQDDTYNIKSEIGNIKKLVRTMFDNKNGSN